MIRLFQFGDSRGCVLKASVFLFLSVSANSLPAFSVPPSAVQEKGQLAQEEAEQYYRKWLNEDVLYIISPEEKDVFLELKTPEEKEQFIEQFWFRRDPDPLTAANEYKEEHYRRIAYANERFSVGMPGWMSDRGRIYIIHGKPAQIESHPTGGQYERKPWDGGGWTQTYPWEVWRYRHIEGIGDNIDIEFVDRSLSGQYKIATSPDDKDALLQMGPAGPTLAEILRQDTKGNRPSLNPLYRDKYFSPRSEAPFERYFRYAKLQSATPIKFKDLQELIKVNVTYDNLPFGVRLDYLRLAAKEVVVPVTIELQDKELTFATKNGERSADVAVYGIVTTITNRVVQEFEDELSTSYPENGPASSPEGRSLYQKVLVLEEGTRYKLDLVLKDLNSGKVGVIRKAVAPPAYSAGDLKLSSLILSDSIYLLDEMAEEESMFVLGNVKIRPNPESSFSLSKPLGVYLQTYGFQIDQEKGNPDLEVRYRILKDGETAVELTDQEGSSIQYFSPERAVILQELPLDGLVPGEYRLAIDVRDRLSDHAVSSETAFALKSEP